MKHLQQRNLTCMHSTQPTIKCSYPGCKNGLNDVCAVTEAGFINYTGLPGAIKSGCQLSPGFQSKFCDYHSLRVACMSVDETTSHAGIVGIITNKKTTHSGTFYEVYASIILYMCVYDDVSLWQHHVLGFCRLHGFIVQKR